MRRFRAVVRSSAFSAGTAQIIDVADADLMPGEVDVAISFSAVNRVDAQLATGAAPLSSTGRLILGSDLFGVVVRSLHSRWREGDSVVATGHGLGRTHHGGWAELARLPGAWLLPQPEGLTPEQAMAVGSAGLAAMQAALALDYHGVVPETGPILVTGASGGVGSLGVLALTCLGFAVTAATGRPQFGPYLKSLGATDVIATDELGPGDELGPERWAGAVDCLGGTTLAGLLATTRRGGAVVSVGDVTCDRTASSLAPFTGRAVAVLGVDMVNAPRSRRVEVWERWTECAPSFLALITRSIPLEDVLVAADALLGRRSHGRTVVDVRRSSSGLAAAPH